MLPDEKDWEEERADAQARDEQWAAEDLAEANRAEEALADAAAEEEGKALYAEFASYPGDEYFISGWEDSGLYDSFEAALAGVQSSWFLCNTLGFGGLEYILSDKYATAGLRRHIVQRNSEILIALADYGKNLKIRRKRGRKKPALGYEQDRVAALRAQGKTFGAIALALWGDPKMRNKASALYRQAMKKKSPTPSAKT